jgi:hypothetical protein
MVVRKDSKTTKALFHELKHLHFFIDANKEFKLSVSHKFSENSSTMVLIAHGSL